MLRCSNPWQHSARRALQEIGGGDGGPSPFLASPRSKRQGLAVVITTPSDTFSSVSPSSHHLPFSPSRDVPPYHSANDGPKSRLQLGNSPSASADLSSKFAEAVKVSSLFLRPGTQGSNLEPGNASPSSRPAGRVALMKARGRDGKPEEALRLLRQMRESFPTRRRYPREAVLCFNTALNAVVENGGGLRDVAEVLGQMKSAGVPMDVSTHNILLKIKADGGPMDASTHNILFELCSCTHSLDDWVFGSMSKRGCRPDETTYSTFIQRLAQVGKIDDAYDVLQQMLEQGCRPNTYSYTPILKALCVGRKMGDAKNLMKFMKMSGCAPNAVAYNILISGFCKDGNFHEVKKILSESTVNGWKPNVITYNTYMDGLCKAGRTREAFALLDIMLESGLYPSSVTINILLAGLCHESDPREAKLLLERAYELKWVVSTVNYNTVMSAFCGIKEWSAVVNLWSGMLRRGVLPDTRTYNIVIYSLCKAGKLGKAKRVKNNGIVAANVVTYNTLIDGFLGLGKESEAENLLKSMREEKIQHDLFTYSIRIGHLCREGKISDAVDLFKILKQRLSPDAVVYSTLICGTIRHGDFNRGRQLLKEMLKRGLVPNVPLIDSLIRAHCRRGFCESGDICIILEDIFPC